MHPNRLNKFVASSFAVFRSATAVSILLLTISACAKKDPVPTVTTASTATSRNNRLKFKGGERFVVDLATGLSLKRDEVCTELGQYDCNSIVHNIALGGVEPYVQTVYAPVVERTTSASNASERIALSACQLRANRDFATPADAVVFKELASDSGNVTLSKVDVIAQRLHRDLLGRDANPQELQALQAFWVDLKASEKDAAKAFAAYACFAVATSEEALFY